MSMPVKIRTCLVLLSAAVLAACSPGDAAAGQADPEIKAAPEPIKKDGTGITVKRPETKSGVKIDNSSTTKIVMLGTGTPVPTPARSGPSVAIVVGDDSYIFDFGPGIVRQAAKMSPRFNGPFDALRGKNLKVAFLTHLHSDHTAGFADLLLTGWTGGHRKEPLKLIGPEGIQELVDGTLEAYDVDIKYRVYGLEDTNNTGWRVDVTEVSEGSVFEDDNVKVIAFPVPHGSWPNAFGYRIETADKTIVISGDLRPNEKIKEYSQGADYLIHEVYCERGLVENMKPIRQTYHRGNHTSTKELAKLANDVKPAVLILTHVLPFGCSYTEVLKEVTSDYSGKVIMAKDLDVFK